MHIDTCSRTEDSSDQHKRVEVPLRLPVWSKIISACQADPPPAIRYWGHCLHPRVNHRVLRTLNCVLCGDATADVRLLTFCGFDFLANAENLEVRYCVGNPC